MLFAKNNFEEEISKVFYDKEITKLEVKQQKDEEGGLLPPEIVETEQFKGNINANTALTIEKFGADTTAKITLSTSTKTNIKLGDKLKHNGETFEVVELAIHDTYQKAGLKKWKSK